MEAKLIKDRLFLRKVADSYVLHRIKDGILTIEGDSQYTIGGIEPFYKLSLKNCQAIELGYDLDELAKEELLKAEKHHKLLSPITYRDGVIKGFQKALEIRGDKKFSEEDVKLAINIAWDDDNLSTIDIIQELQQTEWDVEIVEEDSKIVESHIWDGSNDGELTWKKQPLFDADGCLILRKI